MRIAFEGRFLSYCVLGGSKGLRNCLFLLDIQEVLRGFLNLLSCNLRLQRFRGRYSGGFLSKIVTLSVCDTCLLLLLQEVLKTVSSFRLNINSEVRMTYSTNTRCRWLWLAPSICG